MASSIRDKCKSADVATLQAYKTVVHDLLKDYKGSDADDLKGAEGTRPRDRGQRPRNRSRRDWAGHGNRRRTAKDDPHLGAAFGIILLENRNISS